MNKEIILDLSFIAGFTMVGWGVNYVFDIGVASVICGSMLVIISIIGTLRRDS